MRIQAEAARAVLGAGGAVVLPNPAPLTHVVAARTREAVNLAKGRPAGQSTALWAHDAGILAQVLAVTAAEAVLARRLLVEERVTLLIPLRAGATVPPWLVPASKDGWVLLFGARWRPVLAILDEHPVLYVSSANRTGHPPAASTAEALAMFPADVPVLDLAAEVPAPPGELSAPEASGEGSGRRATTTIRLDADGRLGLHRPGAQDRAHDDYLDYLLTTYA